VAKGKLRMHQKPNAREIGACLPWLDAEIELIRPHVLVAMGATAAQALFGKSIKVTQDHGHFLPSHHAPHATITLHPSAILRAQTDEDRERSMDLLVDDLRIIANVLSQAANLKKR